jgi:tRNA U34 5-methylaminomethyl-2-thiouridine-forming methyltransferase MnmC
MTNMGLDDREHRIITTDDGSSSVYLPLLNETYHSFHGAIQESRHVFIRNGLEHWIKGNTGRAVHILEIGFGTGLNAILTLESVASHTTNVHYTTLEAFPLPAEILNGLNYKSQFSSTNLSVLFDAMHHGPWEEPYKINNQFLLEKKECKLEDYWPNKEIDVVYFDAFAPSKQPELWTLTMLEKTTAALSSGGIFVTYCAKGQLKRDLKSLGMTVETLPGPPGKKEMVRAMKP